MPFDLKATLTKKVGPLPLWGWVGVVGGGVYIGRKYLGKSGGGATSILSGGNDSTGTATGFGESALPVDVTGRAAVDVAAMPLGIAGYDSLPIPTDLGGYDILPDISSSTVTPQPATTTAAPPIVNAGCTKPHKPMRLGAYPDAPHRECPQGWHANRIPFTPCFGWCVPN
jgi:hypothetical protein